MLESMVSTQIQLTLYNLVQSLMEKAQSNAQNVNIESETTVDGDYQGYQNTSFASIIERVSDKYGVDPSLVGALIKNESNFNVNAESYAGAQGLMQLMPATAASLGVSDSFDPYQNIEGGVKYLSNLLDMYNGDVSLSLAAYNAGPGAVNSYGGIPPYQETQTYVQRVLSTYTSGSINERI
ncbi:MAG: lytic transglycosylase domain-containing protein [Anaerolineaceae bacterium]|nr:lytic transglycosylase domain-containing protein [Anaerolineaceae bacterium]